MKYKKRIASVSYFAVCFAKTLAKHRQNVKHEKCIASLKLAIHLSFLAFWHVCALFREIANQWLYTSHNIVNFVHLWFSEKLAVLSSLMFCVNTDCLERTAKREMRKMIGETVYKMPSIHFSFLSFHQHFFAFSSIWRWVFNSGLRAMSRYCMVDEASVRKNICACFFVSLRNWGAKYIRDQLAVFHWLP